MAPREYMIEFRREFNVDLRRMARLCGISQTLLAMLESNDKEVTHPVIAERVGKKYRLTKKQIEGMKPENYRKSSPNYDPDRFKEIPGKVITVKT